MIPSPWEFVLLTLAVYRLCRLIGWDTITRRPRDWAIGASLSPLKPYDPDNPEQTCIRSVKRARLEEFLTCPFCLGFWLSLVAYVAWRLTPRETLVISSVLALSAAVGLLTTSLDSE